MNNQTAFVLARLAVGVSFFGHGLVRLPKLSLFSQWMVGNFQKSMLPDFLVLPFSYFLPIVEFATGLLLVVGLFTRFASIAGSLIMIALIFGCCMIEEWSAIPSQLFHVAFLCALLSTDNQNKFSVDRLLDKSKSI